MTANKMKLVEARHEPFLREDLGGVAGYCKAQDCPKRHYYEEQLRHNALYDALTGLPGRELLIGRVSQHIELCERDPREMVTLLMLDVDRFDRINEALGHEGGNLLLVALSRRLGNVLRDRDTLARLGRDSFAILLDDIQDVRTALRVAERIHKAFGAPFRVGEHDVYLTVSIGIGVGKRKGEVPETVLGEAGIAMRRARKKGKGCTEVFKLSMQAQGMEALRIESELRRAIENEELELFYQPILSLQSGALQGCEALLRWRHPARGLVPPGDFIPVAEETGLIVPIGEWVLRTACRQLKTWQEAGHPELYVAVNISAMQLQQGSLCASILRALDESGIDPSSLKIELTESAVMQNVEEAISTLSELREMGIHLSMDDFGTGYSSLGYLKRFRFETLKIDRSFVADLTSNPDSAAIATAIVHMAHSLKLGVVAEGVETADQMHYLRDMGCEEMQGFLYSRALPVAGFQLILEEGRGLPLDLRHDAA